MSLKLEDGYIRESSEGSGIGGPVFAGNNGNAALRSGDDSGDRQFKAVVSFDPTSLPATAKVVGAELILVSGSTQGTPESSLGSAGIQLSIGGFGASPALASQDFEAPATVEDAGVVVSTGDDSHAVLAPGAVDAISTADRIQLRVAHPLATDGDRRGDYEGWYSANASNASRRPRLVIEYID